MANTNKSYAAAKAANIVARTGQHTLNGIAVPLVIVARSAGAGANACMAGAAKCGQVADENKSILASLKEAKMAAKSAAQTMKETAQEVKAEFASPEPVTT